MGLASGTRVEGFRVEGAYGYRLSKGCSEAPNVGCWVLAAGVEVHVLLLVWAWGWGWGSVEFCEHFMVGDESPARATSAMQAHQDFMSNPKHPRLGFRFLRFRGKSRV